MRASDHLVITIKELVFSIQRRGRYHASRKEKIENKTTRFPQTYLRMAIHGSRASSTQVELRSLNSYLLSMRRELGRVTIRHLPSRTPKLKTVGESLTEEERAACLLE
ncbi:TPA_asm: hypothetical protein HUJ06_031901 [Nelumbo nucifera]|uniref:Uncharacterized protein n=1 Tax=Nelumbo nucifera TaxID=4432 RepID=A0A822ZXN5_NELNU|nr:TPA_asm: hypothetical protein HUJ06_030738 [Nelumbo nucifera]DAD49793.1 TPA_asm: hypothetical protein HUJ06_031901 [Nelumbo nucifera]